MNSENFIPKVLWTVILIAAAVLMISLSSCATVWSGTRCTVKVKDGVPAGAKIYVNGNYVGTAPMDVVISKNGLKNKQTVITIKADGFKSQDIILTRRLKIGAFIGDIIFTGGIGLIIDFLSGSIYKAYPGTIHYSLDPE